MSMYQFSDLQFKMRPSDKRKTYGVTVDRDSSLLLHVPEDYSETTIQDFLHEKLLWIHTKLAEKAFHKDGFYPERQFINGEGFAYLGRIYRLKIDPSALQHLRFASGNFILRNPKRGREHFVFWYQTKGYEKLPALIKEYTSRLGVTPGQLKMMDLSNRWASCSESGDLNFHWKMMQLPQKYQRYIVAHEAVHLVEKHHTPQFWRTLERIMPNYEEFESGLNNNAIKYLRLN